MRRAPRVTVQKVTAYTAEVRGDGVHTVLTRLQIPRQFLRQPPSGGPKCWGVPARYAPDVEAMVEHLGGAVVASQEVLG